MGMTIDESIDWIKNTIIDMRRAQICISDRLALETAIDTMRKYQQLENFAKWVAEEVIDEDMWALNHLAFAELACRKLVKLGIIQESNGEYLYEGVEDGNDD